MRVKRLINIIDKAIMSRFSAEYCEATLKVFSEMGWEVELKVFHQMFTLHRKGEIEKILFLRQKIAAGFNS